MKSKRIYVSLLIFYLSRFVRLLGMLRIKINFLIKKQLRPSRTCVCDNFHTGSHSVTPLFIFGSRRNNLRFKKGSRRSCFIPLLKIVNLF